MLDSNSSCFTAQGNVWSEPFTDHHATEREVLSRTRSFFGVPEDPNPIVFNLGYPKKFLEIVGFSLTPHQELGQALRDYLESALNLPSAPTTLAAASASELETLHEDKRVREFTPEERTPIIEWLKLGSELMMVERMHEVRVHITPTWFIHLILFYRLCQRHVKAVMLSSQALEPRNTVK